MSWQDPSWGRMQDNQNGTFPFNRDSTAFALDYIGGFLRGCYEGWVTWLRPHRRLPGRATCAAAWGPGTTARGSRRTPARYIGRVWRSQRERPWLEPGLGATRAALLTRAAAARRRRPEPGWHDLARPPSAWPATVGETAAR